jgi:hypothetical protein
MIFLPASSRFQRTRSPSPEFLYTPTWSSGGQSTVHGRPSARTHARHRGRCLPASERRPNYRRGDGSTPFLARSTSLQDQSSPETGGYPASWPPWPGTGGCPVSQPPWLGSGTPCEEEGARGGGCSRIVQAAEVAGRRWLAGGSQAAAADRMGAVRVYRSSDLWQMGHSGRALGWQAGWAAWLFGPRD